MLKAWLNKNLSLGEKYLCVEAIVITDEKLQYNGTLFVKKGKDILLEQSAIDTEPLAIKKMAGTDFPVLLSITGKGVLVKHLGTVPFEDVSLKQVFPNSNADEFLYQSSLVQQSTYISILRRSSFDAIFSELSIQGFKIVNVFLGPSCVSGIKQELTPTLENIHTASYVLTFNEVGLETKTNPEPVQKQYQFRQQQLSSTILIPFASLNAYLNNKSEYTQPDHEGLQLFATDEKYRQRFETVARIGLVVLLAMFILNRLLSYQYTKEYAELEVQQALRTGETQESSELKKELEIKKELATATGLTQGKAISFYSDQIAALIPADISLTEIQVFPVVANGGSKNNTRYNYNTIVVSGKTVESASISQLVKDLGNLDWTENAAIDRVSDQEGVLSFTIQISLK